MRERVLACIFPFVQEFMNSPISIQLIVAGGECSEYEANAVFLELLDRKMLIKKNELDHVYELTEDGFALVNQAYTNLQSADCHTKTNVTV